MTTQTAPFSLDQIGTGTARFQSGMAIPTPTDAMVDPYIRTRVSKDVHVECIQFWPKIRVSLPGIVLLHDWWGLNSQITALGARLALQGMASSFRSCTAGSGHGHGQCRSGGGLSGQMQRQALPRTSPVANTSIRLNASNGTISRRQLGSAFGASLAVQFACQRKRLRAAVAYYGKVTAPE